MIIGKEFEFCASHKLSHYNGKCNGLHGHTWKLIVCIEDSIKKDGMILDFKEFKEQVNERVIDKLDHAHLNDIVENPTCENLLLWIQKQLKGLKIYELKLYESGRSFCILKPKAL